MSAIQKYQIHVSDVDTRRLKLKLELTDLPKPVGGSDNSWDQGPPLGEISRLVEAWRTTYDWKRVEARLNELPNFTTSINTERFGSFDVHFIHKKSSSPTAIPLLFLHGWPGSFLEVTKILNGLVNGDGGNGTSFHVVAPSLIDFGFSSPSPVS